MNSLCGIIMSILITTTSPSVKPNDMRYNMIDAYIAAYDAMYNDTTGGFYEENKKYIILDMESFHWLDVSYEDKQKVLEYFNKYKKTVVSSSLVHLKQIGLADKKSNLKIDGVSLMIEKIDFNSKIYIGGIKWVGPVADQGFSITLDYINKTWKVVEFKPTWIV